MTPQISFLLGVALSLAQLVTSRSTCPSQCACADVSGGVRVDCRSRSLSAVVRILPPQTVELDFGENVELSFVNRSSFPVLGNLRVLRLDGCRIQRVESQTFENLASNLEFLDLSRNIIAEIELGAFDRLRYLRQLRLDGNRLSSDGLPDSVFRGLSLTLLRLDSNRLDSLPGGVFEDAAVSELNLDRNKFKSIGASSLRPLRDTLRSLTVSDNARETMSIDATAFHGFIFTDVHVAASGLRNLSFLEDVASVEVLDVGDNPIGVVGLQWSSGLRLSCREARLAAINLSSIADAQLSSFRSIQRLDLSANRLAGTLDVAEFRSVPDLRHLDLSRNAISRLPAELVVHLSRLETLNLSGNALREVDAAAFAGTEHLSLLDVSRNRIQVLARRVRRLFDALSFVGVVGNPLHCNCELRWFRRWVAASSARVFDVADVLCASPSTMVGPLVVRNESAFVCRGPRRLRISPHVAAAENTEVTLSCSASGDPAPELVWRSPTNDRMRVSPQLDRTVLRNTAIWGLRILGPEQAGWYSCNATNVESTRTQHAYVHVSVPGDSPVDLANLEYPMIPQPIWLNGTTKETTTTLSTSTSTPPTSTSRSTVAAPRTTATNLVTTVALRELSTTHARQTSDWINADGNVTRAWGTSHRPVDAHSGDFWDRVFLIVGCALGGLVLVILVILLAVCCVRLCRKRRRVRIRAKQRFPPAPKPVHEDRIRRAPFHPGVSMALQDDGKNPPPLVLPASPSCDPERADLLHATIDRNYDDFQTFNGKNRARGVNGGTTTPSEQLRS